MTQIATFEGVRKAINQQTMWVRDHAPPDKLHFRLKSICKFTEQDYKRSNLKKIVEYYDVQA